MADITYSPPAQTAEPDVPASLVDLVNQIKGQIDGADEPAKRQEAIQAAIADMESYVDGKLSKINSFALKEVIKNSQTNTWYFVDFGTPLDAGETKHLVYDCLNAGDSPSGATGAEVYLQAKDGVSDKVKILNASGTLEFDNVPISELNLFRREKDGNGKYFLGGNFNDMESISDLTNYYTKVETDANITAAVAEKLEAVAHDATLSGDGTAASPLSASGQGTAISNSFKQWRPGETIATGDRRSTAVIDTVDNHLKMLCFQWIGSSASTTTKLSVILANSNILFKVDYNDEKEINWEFPTFRKSGTAGTDCVFASPGTDITGEIKNLLLNADYEYNWDGVTRYFSPITLSADEFLMTTQIDLRNGSGSEIVFRYAIVGSGLPKTVTPYKTSYAGTATYSADGTRLKLGAAIDAVLANVNNNNPYTTSGKLYNYFKNFLTDQIYSSTKYMLTRYFYLNGIPGGIVAKDCVFTNASSDISTSDGRFNENKNLDNFFTEIIDCGAYNVEVAFRIYGEMEKLTILRCHMENCNSVDPSPEYCSAVIKKCYIKNCIYFKPVCAGGDEKHFSSVEDNLILQDNTCTDPDRTFISYTGLDTQSNVTIRNNLFYDFSSYLATYAIGYLNTFPVYCYRVNFIGNIFKGVNLPDKKFYLHVNSNYCAYAGNALGGMQLISVDLNSSNTFSPNW